jgi:hypothetical protein
MTKQVTFGNLTIHEHALELGDNPACSCGAPLTISWKAHNSITRNLELYEYMRGSRRYGRKQLAMEVTDRAKLLLSSGYDIVEIANATMEVDEIKKQRAESLKGTNLERFGKMMANMSLKPIRNTVQARSA